LCVLGIEFRSQILEKSNFLFLQESEENQKLIGYIYFGNKKVIKMKKEEELDEILKNYY
jgi:hypothetical protein